VPPLEDDDGFEQIPFQLQVSDSDTSGPSRSRHSLSSASVPSYSRNTSPNSSMLPLPPPKSRMAAPTFYEYLASFEEDIIGVEPDAGPSAPPFEIDECLAPSAPPLDIDYMPQGSDALPSASPEEIDSELVLSQGLDDPARDIGETPAHQVDAPSASPPALVPSAWSRNPPGYLP